MTKTNCFEVKTVYYKSAMFKNLSIDFQKNNVTITDAIIKGWVTVGEMNYLNIYSELLAKPLFGAPFIMLGFPETIAASMFREIVLNERNHILWMLGYPSSRRQIKSKWQIKNEMTNQISCLALSV